MHEPTISFSIHEDKEQQLKEILTAVYDALRQKGYNPINQIVGYILSEDPTYITTHNNARALIRKIDRDELLQLLVKSQLLHKPTPGGRGRYSYPIAWSGCGGLLRRCL